MFEFNALPMIQTHCPICRKGPRFDCSDMEHCPLALAKFNGVFIKAEEFSKQYNVHFKEKGVVQCEDVSNDVGQLILF